ncbi:DUF1760-domain-containing protein [Aulographum hederae CBS 113979]|uniref:DUF1760-domain-containing protein n=1 Tax=Aulographum hederae CBS 113979 TaxID=1176131 RepID=A0A6G1GLK5_9PEZI|nr:DUF1760-domain-containing protein [Aulographum hederae CBS 113979]
MASTNEEDPLIATLPPKTDPITYLTIIEYNLTKERLPTLHNILQDIQLTLEIGWDLVHLLMPLLPESQVCLQDIARLGNPREVVLKVTESLRLIEIGAMDEEDPDEDEAEPEDTDDGFESTLKTIEELKLSIPGAASESTTQKAKPQVPLQVLQFQELVSMLSVLHPRIKTRHPSRFLSTSLQAVLAVYSQLKSVENELTDSVISFVGAVAGTRRPQLPPRRSTSQLVTQAALVSAPDPEANSQPASGEDLAIYDRLLQSFITHVLEDYMLSLTSVDDTPGLAWGSRLLEKLEPDRVFRGPQKTSFTDKFARSETLSGRLSTVGQIVAVARDLDLNSTDLHAAVMDVKKESTGQPAEEDEPPSSVEDIPLSKTGSLFLVTARKVAGILYGSDVTTPPVAIFPDHATIIKNFMGGRSPATIGMEPEALIDCILALGVLALEDNNIGEPEDNEAFSTYLHTISVISANTPSPSLRAHAHYLTSTILRSHPDSTFRFSFIHDTLENCPFENLKESAVGWLKGETIEANPMSHRGSHAHDKGSESDDEAYANKHSIFSTPLALGKLSPFLFPDLTLAFSSTPAESLPETWAKFRLELGFYMAALNFYYLLLVAKHLHEPLDIKGLHETADIGGSYLGPLRKAVQIFGEDLEKGQEGQLWNNEGDQGVKDAKMDIERLQELLGVVEGAVKRLNSE